MLRKLAICALAAAAIVAVGCGGSDDSPSEDDTQAITELVAKVNAASENKDASEFCLIMQPSAVEKTFHGIDRCVSETKRILNAVGDQPALEIEAIEVDGDVATVQFSGSAGGEANFVKEDGQWYVPLQTDDPATGQADTSTSESEG